MNIYIIYKHTSPSGKSYIGLTKNLKQREQRHKSKNNCRAFRAAIVKYGWDMFTHEVLQEGLTLDEANAAERRYISEYNTLAPNGYNLTSGGDRLKEVSEETKLLLSNAAIGKPSHRKGVKCSIESKIKMSLSAKAKIITEEHKANRETARLDAIVKSYNVLCPDSQTIVISNLKQWCIDRGFDYDCAFANIKRKKPFRSGPLIGFKFSRF